MASDLVCNREFAISYSVAFESFRRAGHQWDLADFYAGIKNRIDLYDVARALIGFHRSLAITTHLLLNGEVVDKNFSLENANIKAKIFAPPSEVGSWKQVAVVVLAPIAFITPIKDLQDSLMGHLLSATYEYVTKKATGIQTNFEDFRKSYGEEEARKLEELGITIPNKELLDDAAEKCKKAFEEMRLPSKSKTVHDARIFYIEGETEIELVCFYEASPERSRDDDRGR